MANKRNALGKGLSALLENYDTDVTAKPHSAGVTESQPENAKVVGSVAAMPLSSIEANPFQPRTKFEEVALNELAESIKQFNLVQPITVRKLGYDKYQIISGERRFRAAKLAGLDTIPAYIRIANDQEMLEIALVENIQREELNAMEIAISYKRLTEECDLTQEELSDRIGKNRTTVTNYLRLLKLPAEIQIGIRDNKIQMGHARALITVENEEEQMTLFKKCVKNGLSVRQIEALVKNASSDTEASKNKTSTSLSSEHKKLAYQLSTHFDRKVELKRYNNKTGKIVIPFNSDEDLKKLIDTFGLD